MPWPKQYGNKKEMDEKQVSVDIFTPDLSSHLPLPYADQGIQAGFPSPAQDYISESLDLNREIVMHPAATFYGRVSGESMIGDGIDPGDIIVIDRSLEPEDGDLAVCCLDGDFTLKRIRLEKNRIWLVPSNEKFDPILVTPDSQFEVWGVVTHTIKRSRRKK
jgi:DNA polymerase V